MKVYVLVVTRGRKDAVEGVFAGEPDARARRIDLLAGEGISRGWKVRVEEWEVVRGAEDRTA